MESHTGNMVQSRSRTLKDRILGFLVTAKEAWEHKIQFWYLGFERWVEKEVLS